MPALTTLEYAESYFKTKLHTESWDLSDMATKEALLYEATRKIFAIPGFKFTPDAIMLLSEIPVDLKQACCEIALGLIEIKETDPHVVNQKLGIKSISFGKDSVSYGDSYNSIGFDNPVFNDFAKYLLDKYIIKAVPYV